MNFGIGDSVGHQRRGADTPRGLVPRASGCSLTFDRKCWWPECPTRRREPDERLVTQESKKAGDEFRVRHDDMKLLKAIAASKVFTEFERAFTGATGLAVALRPVESFQLSFHSQGNQGPFCTVMARESRTCGACLQAQSRVADPTRKGAHTSVCYAGLCETVVPLKLGNRLIGFLWTGQVFQGKPSELQFQRTLKLLTTWGMKLEQNVLRGAYFETQVVSREQHTAAVKLLEIFAEHLAILSNQIVIQTDNAEPPMITKAKEFIREHHTEDLSLPQVAQFAHADRFHFCRMFKRATGLNFTNFLSRVRIEKSKNLLINPQLRVSEIAYEVGFQSLTHFNRVFQKLLGQSPTEYRQKLQGSNKPLCR